MLDVYVNRVNLEGPMKEVEVPQTDFQFWPCPICQTEKDSILISEVRSGDTTSMESAYCLRCEHRYFRKAPSAAWLNRYYAEEFDTGHTGLTGPPSGLKAAIKRLPGTEAAWWKLAQTLGRELPGLRQMRAFLEGIVATDGGYYLRRSDIRKVLEVGCGYGGKLNMFRRLGYETYGVEASRLRADECRRQGLNVFDCPVTHLGPVRQYGPYDFVYSIHVLEHIGDVSDHLAQLSGLLREGGMLYIQVPNLWLGETLFMQSHAAIHCHTFSSHSLTQLMHKHGFTPVRLQADNNLHILASKTPPCGPQPSWKDSAALGQLLECLSWAGNAEGGRYRISFDHAHVQVNRVDDDKVVYKRDPFLSIQKTPYRHTVEFSLGASGESASFPVRFLYERTQPPVWAKKQ
jgi:2-polyprenyl-3-methyl-5-hydroxy-6-metoxy-1,4-benzoquinol methylase